MKNCIKFIKILSVLLCITAVLAGIVILLYLKVLPAVVSNEKTVDYVKEFVKESTGAQLVVEEPKLRTSLTPQLGFGIKKLLLTKDKKELLTLENLDTEVSFTKILEKTVVLKKINIGYFFADANGLMTLGQPSEDKQPAPSDWTVEWLDSLLSLDKCLILYDFDKDTHIKIDGKNMVITAQREPKLVHFDLGININKGKHNVKIAIKDENKVYIKDHKLFIDKANLAVNNSKMFVDTVSDEKNRFKADIYANKFDVKNVVELLETDLVVPNGSEMLAFFKDIDGNFDFKINMTNKDLNGEIKLNKASLKVVPLNNLPVFVNGGNVKITNTDITLSDFKGRYGSLVKNVVQFSGTIKDYTKSVDTYIEATGKATDDLTKNYLSKIVGIPLTLTGDCGAKMILKSKYGKIDMTFMAKVAKGYDILVDGASLSPVGYDRAVVADMHLDGSKLNIEAIKYYIAEELNKQTKGIKPILTVDGNMDIVSAKIHDIGFNIPKPLPSEFLNVLIGQKVFKKGTIAGNMHVVYYNDIPKIDGNLEMNGVRIPSQRLSIKKARLYTDKNLINVTAQGRFKKSQYKFDGHVKNELVFPIIVKDVNLTVDNVDAEKFIASMNQQPTAEQTTSQAFVSNSDNDDNDDDALYVFDTNMLIIEKCILHVVKGFYKDIKFGNLIANLTLNKHGQLEIKSNKFDFAEGISTLKVLCDLKNHKYYIRLGVNNVNSDLLATNILSLKKEISGKARGLIELNTDDTLKLNGRIRFDVKDGTIQKVGLVQYALNFVSLFRNPMAMISPSVIFDMVNIPDGKFDVISGDLILKDNVVELLKIKSSAPQLGSFIIGRYDLETGDAALRIYTKFSNKNKGFAGFLRYISLNSLANRMSVTNDSEANYYAWELSQLPKLEADEKDCQVFLTKVDGDVEHFNFLSSLKKIK